MPTMVFDHIVNEPKKCSIILSEAAPFTIIKNDKDFLHVEKRQ